MTAPILTVRDYSLALFGALCAAGVDPQQASDCANNAAGPIAAMPEYTVAEVISSSLRTQRAVGHVVSDETIARAAEACARVPRFVEQALPVEDTRRALSEPCEVDEPSIADELEAEFGGIFDEPRARVDSDRSPRSAEVGRAPTGGAL